MSRVSLTLPPNVTRQRYFVTVTRRKLSSMWRMTSIHSTVCRGGRAGGAGHARWRHAWNR